MDAPLDLNLWARQWRAERISRARTEFNRHAQVWLSLRNKDTDYARSVKQVRDTCEQVLALWEASPVDLPATTGADHA